MASVDEFLEQVSEDYAALFKENAVLKGKLKVLVEKVEEYRSTEDSMRMALLTAQKMGNEIIDEAKQKSDSIISEANNQIRLRQEEVSSKLAQEEERLRRAERATSDFSKRILSLYKNQVSFIRELSSLSMSEGLDEALSDASETAAKTGQPTDKTDEPTKRFSPSEALNTSVDNLIEGAMNQVQAAMAAENEVKMKERAVAQSGDESVNIAQSISQSLGDDEQFPFDQKTVWDDEDEPTTKRPKFDFDDLKFGENYNEDK